MIFPARGSYRSNTVNVPTLNGGLNLRDGITQVNDNQLTDCENMWFKDGALRSRQGFQTNNELTIYRSTPSGIDHLIEENVRIFDEIFPEKKLIVAKITGEKAYQEGEYTIVNFFRFFIEDKRSRKEIGSLVVEEEITNYFVTLFREKLYCYLDNFEIYSLDLNVGTWSLVPESDYYVPLIFTKGIPPLNNVGNVRSSALPQATMIEGYNAIGKYYKVKYDTVDYNVVFDGKSTYPLYKLPFKIVRGMGTIKLSFVDGEGTKHTHTINTNEDPTGASGGDPNWPYWDEAERSTDGFFMRTGGYSVWLDYYEQNRTAKTVLFSAKGTSIKTYDKNGANPMDSAIPSYVENGIEIIAEVSRTDEEKKKIFGMTQSAWFGGTSSGLSQGTRLFICGNEEEPNLVMYSGLNNPTYFDENNYFYVGNATEKVVTFGKQGNLLVIFKEFSTYYTYYKQLDISAQDLISQNIVDYETNSVIFPLILLNDEIGCDCPNTVQLCRNRLVWAHTNGKVYSLTTTENTNERSIFKVSDMVERKLSIQNDATSADWNGHYCLYTGNGNLFLMDYNSSGFQYIYSYAKEKDAQVKIPWYFWKIPYIDNARTIDVYTDNVLFNVGEELAFANAINSLSSSYRMFDGKDKKLDGDNYKECDFNSMFQTKIFDFGTPSFRKNVDRVDVTYGNNGGEEISVTFVTDVCNEEGSATITEDELTPYTAGYLTTVPFYPCCRSVTRFGVKNECSGNLVAFGMDVTYKLLGGVK